MGKVITSTKNTLESIHTFNKLIDKLSKDISKNPIADEKIFKASRNVYVSEKLTSYVEDSEKYRDLVEKIADVESNVKMLKGYNYHEEMIYNACRTERLIITKHTYDTIKDTGYANGDEDPIQNVYVQKNIFYTKGEYAPTEIITDWKILKFPYHDIRYTDEECRDLIQSTIDAVKQLRTLVHIYHWAEKMDLTVCDLRCILDVEKISEVEYDYINYNERSYSQNNLKDLIKAYHEDKDNMFIRDDKYVEYPKNYVYIKFLEMLKEGIYRRK